MASINGKLKKPSAGTKRKRSSTKDDFGGFIEDDNGELVYEASFEGMLL